MARTCGDFLSPEQQQRLYPLASRLAHTQVPELNDRYILSVRLACWATRQVLPFAACPESAERAVAAAEAWCDGDAAATANLRLLEQENNDRTNLTEAERAVLWVRKAVTLTPIGHALANAVEFVAQAIHHNHADQSDDAVADRVVTLLTEFLDEFDRLIGRTPVDLLAPDRVAALYMLAALT